MSLSVVVGANGFIGSTLVARLVADGKNVVAVQRKLGQPAREINCTSVTCTDLVAFATADWRRLFEDAEVVYFVAGFAHADVANGRQLLINSDTPAIAYDAANANCVRKFVWLSTIKVLGNVSCKPLSSDFAPDPQDEYARSKLVGEGKLLAAANSGDTELAIVRPPLVYGPGVKGNFLTLLEKTRRGGFLPLGSADVVRSMVAVDNLIDLLIRLGQAQLKGSAASEAIWHVCDNEKVTVAQLLKSLAVEFGSSLNLLPVPLKPLEWCLRLTGNSQLIERLLRNMEVDQRSTRDQLDWQPPIEFSLALRRTVQWYQQQV